MERISLPPGIDAPGRGEALAALCQRHGVRRLELFGSAANGAFDPARSDVDLLVTFDPNPPGGAFDAYFGFKEDAETLFGRAVDLLTTPVAKIANPYLRGSIERSRRPLYGER